MESTAKVPAVVDELGCGRKRLQSKRKHYIRCLPCNGKLVVGAIPSSLAPFLLVRERAGLRDARAAEAIPHP